MLGMCGLHVVWAMESLAIGGATALTLWAPDVSRFLTDLVYYGKAADFKRSRFHKFIEVPKRYFTHFYVVGVFASTFFLASVIMQYEKKTMNPSRMLPTFRALSYPMRTATVDEASIQLCVTMWWFHTVRRLLESAFLSVYSDTTMNLLHYLLGLLHYILVPISLLAQAPGFISKGNDQATVSQLTNFQMFAVGFYAFCSFYQHKVFCKFAHMRKNYLGNVTNYAHAIPTGGWFELVSCPHFLFEIGIYLSMVLALGIEHSLFFLVFCFVVVNQTMAALITHNWYQNRFTKYPPGRKAIFPFLL